MKLKYALILALGFALGHVSYSAMQASIQTPTPLTLGNPWTVDSATADPTISAEIAAARANWVAAAQASVAAGIQD